MKENVERPDAAGRHQPPALSEIEEADDGGLRIGALVHEHRRRLRRRGSSGATRCCPRPSSPAPRRSSATWRRRAATSCSGRAAPTSTTPPRRATSASRAAGCPAHRRLQPQPRDPGHERALHRDAPVRHVRRARGAGGRRPRGRARAASAPSRSPSSTACPATRPHLDTNLGPDELITRGRPARRGLRRASHLPEGPRPHCPTPSPWSRSPPRWRWTAARSRRPASRWAAWRTSPGAIPEAEALLRGQPADRRQLQRGGRRHPARRHGASSTTPSRSSWPRRAIVRALGAGRADAAVADRQAHP